MRKALMVGDLAAPVVQCFRSPLDIQHRHAEAIQTALDEDRKTVLRRADRIRQLPSKLTPAAIVEALVGPTTDAPSKPQVLEFEGKPLGTWRCDRAGRIAISVSPGVVPAEGLDAVMQSVAKALSGNQN